MHPYIVLFGISVSAYALLAYIGAAAVALYWYLAHKSGRYGVFLKADLLRMGILIAIAGMLGAKLLFALTMIPIIMQDWASFSGDWLTIFEFAFSGMVYYGGILGAALITHLYCKKYRLDAHALFAMIVPSVPLFHAFGRIGCFLSGCCWGVEVEHCGVMFNRSISAPNGVMLFPVQLVEAAGNILLVIILTFAARKPKYRSHILRLYFLLYAIMRFALEFFRGDILRGVWILSTSQWISLIIIAAALLSYLKRKRQFALRKHNI